jgi:ubiquinone/menaquinone biosynthesis C-methylase UbiE
MEKMKTANGLPNRPGGFVITDKAISVCSFPAKAKILDLGCGSGATLHHLKRNYDFDVCGIDKHPDIFNNQNSIVNAVAEDIPLSSSTQDGIIMECSFSVMSDPEKVLNECHRVLKSDGRLIISDMYARGDPATLKGILGCIRTKEYLFSQIERNGFSIDFFEDFSYYLQAMWGQMIFEQGATKFYCSLGVTPETIKRIKCGYFLLLATKKRELQ